MQFQRYVCRNYIMEINIQYLIPLLLAWVFTGWLFKLDYDTSKNRFCRAYIMDSLFYQALKVILAVAIIVSIVINGFLVGWTSTLCYVGILVIVQLINVNLLYYLHKSIFGTDYWGVTIPLILAPLSVIYLYIAQFVL